MLKSICVDMPIKDTSSDGKHSGL